VRHLISNKSGPVAVGVGPRARAVLPCGSGGGNPKGMAAYPMHSTGNNHAFAFMERASALRRLFDSRNFGDDSPKLDNIVSVYVSSVDWWKPRGFSIQVPKLHSH
jgi:hypothetical protein